MSKGIDVNLTVMEWTHLLRVVDSRIKALHFRREDPVDPRERYFLSEILDKIIRSLETELDAEK